MSEAANAFHRHARVVLEHELHRARGPLRTLPGDRRRVVEDLAADVAGAVVEGVLDAARVEPALAAALASIYASDPRWEPKALLRLGLESQGGS
jgi:hypothetical protein